MFLFNKNLLSFINGSIICEMLMLGVGFQVTGISSWNAVDFN